MCGFFFTGRAGKLLLRQPHPPLTWHLVSEVLGGNLRGRNHRRRPPHPEEGKSELVSLPVMRGAFFSLSAAVPLCMLSVAGENDPIDSPWVFVAAAGGGFGRHPISSGAPVRVVTPPPERRAPKREGMLPVALQPLCEWKKRSRNERRRPWRCTPLGQR